MSALLQNRHGSRWCRGDGPHNGDGRAVSEDIDLGVRDGGPGKLSGWSSWLLAGGCAHSRPRGPCESTKTAQTGRLPARNASQASSNATRQGAGRATAFASDPMDRLSRDDTQAQHGCTDPAFSWRPAKANQAEVRLGRRRRSQINSVLRRSQNNPVQWASVFDLPCLGPLEIASHIGGDRFPGRPPLHGPRHG